MAFPSVHYGSPGDEKVTSSTKIGSLPLGVEMKIGDKAYVHSRAGGTAIVIGNLYQTVISASSGDAGYVAGLACGSIAVGANSITITAGGTTAIATNQYEDGTIILSSSTGTGKGYTYHVKSNNSAAAGSAAVFKLWENDTVIEAIAGGTTKAQIRQNKYSAVLLTTADTALTGALAGVSCATAAASSYIWLAKKGDHATYVAGTAVTLGQVVVASTAVAGAVADLVASTAGITSSKAGANFVGTARTAGTTNGYAMIDLNL